MTGTLTSTNTIAIKEAPSQSTPGWSISSIDQARVHEAQVWRLQAAVSNLSEERGGLLLERQPFDLTAVPNQIWLPKIRPRSAATLDVTSEKLNSLIQDLVRLEIDAEEEGLIRPTEYAYARTTQIVSDAYVLLWLQELSKYSHLVKPTISTDDLGGLRISWMHSTRIVRANIGAREDLRSYIYFEEGQSHGVEGLEKANLAEKLKWLVP